MADISPGGSEFHRHDRGPAPFEPVPAHGGPRATAVERAIDVAFPEEEVATFHEIVSDKVHVDVHVVPPGIARDWYTLVTTGMSDRAMAVSDGHEDARYAELTLALPLTWDLSTKAFADEGRYWPVRLLKWLARFPHEYETALGEGHTLGNGEPPSPWGPNTPMCGVLLCRPLLLAPELRRIPVVESGDHVDVHAVIPLHEDEVVYKLEAGTEALLLRMDEYAVTELLDPARPSVIGNHS